MNTRNRIVIVRTTFVSGLGLGLAVLLGACSATGSSGGPKSTALAVDTSSPRQGATLVERGFSDLFGGPKTTQAAYVKMRRGNGADILDWSDEGFTDKTAAAIQDGNKVTLEDGTVVDGTVLDKNAKVGVGAGSEALKAARAEIDGVKRAQLRLDRAAVAKEIAVIDAILADYRTIINDPQSDSGVIADANKQLELYTGLRATYNNQLTALDAALSNTNVLLGQAGLTTKSLTEQHFAAGRNGSGSTVASGSR